MVNRFLGGIFPQYCALCNTRSYRELPLCNACQASLAANLHGCHCCALPLPPEKKPRQTRLCAHCLAKMPPYRRVIAPWQYDEQLASLMHRWKFQGERRLAPLFAQLWLDTRPQPFSVDVIVPVPLHWWRLCKRGFNQSEQLCRQLRRRCPHLRDTRLDPGLVSRQRATLSQANLDTRGRIRNLEGAFTVCKPCTGLNIAIVDDVMTTGSTVSALAAALRKAGAKSVEVWCIARTPAPSN